MKVITTERIPIKMWLDELEEGAIGQAKNLANMPYAFSHIAIMPDSHKGFGMPIGAVLATKDVVVPNAVGVDINCFSGDTLIPLIDGTVKTLKELTKRDEKFLVYARDSNLHVVKAYARAMLTRHNSPVIKVTVSGGEEVTCTLDQKFMLIDGEYKEAQKLEKGDILMSMNNNALVTVDNVQNLPYTEDVYDLVVDEYHNFALVSGVFVHNCGMVAVKTDLKAEHVKYDVVEDIMKRVERDIPVGFAQRHASMSVQTDDLLWSLREELPEDGVVYKEYEKAGYQLGTLGGGNHFIEMDKGSDGYIWLMLHSGSRGIGNKVGTYYNKAAIKENEEHYVNDTVRADLAFLRADSQLGKDYLAEMKFCMEYANISRDIMMNTFISDLQEVITEAGVMNTIKIQHNFVDLEKHFGKNVWVHRKGAVPAYIGQRGIIAGSQGTASYIVAGKGNVQSFKTCSHGAGRRMSRTQAVKTLNLKEEQDKLAGIYNNMKTQKSLDEAPSSYKNIETVMNNQKDLVDVLVRLTPLGVVKG